MSRKERFRATPLSGRARGVRLSATGRKRTPIVIGQIYGDAAHVFRDTKIRTSGPRRSKDTSAHALQAGWSVLRPMAQIGLDGVRNMSTGVYSGFTEALCSGRRRSAPKRGGVGREILSRLNTRLCTYRVEGAPYGAL